MHRSISADEQNNEEDGDNKGVTGLTEHERKVAGTVSPPPARDGMPIRGSVQ